MNIYLIKQEIEKLSALVAAWDEGKEVSAIERDLALDKLTKLYEMVRFGTAAGATPQPVEAAPTAEQPEEEPAEKEVEVEFIFAEEDDDSVEQESEVAAETLTTATAIVAEALTPDTEPEVAVTAEPEAEATPEVVAEPVIAAEPEVAAAPEVVAEPEIVVTPEPTPAPAPQPEPVSVQPEPAPAEPERPAEKPQRKPKMESLFGAEEIQRKPRSKHQRMMAIYGDPHEKQEKVVDISKIFELDDDESFEMTTSSNTPAEHTPQSTVNDISSGDTTILADTIAPATTTLADTIAAPAALAEEITNSRIRSLRQAIGINDKFLMTRDLFDGDSEAFDEAIAELDECESLDDCMIYIAENYEWNPDSEGAKFMIQLLERKHS